MEPKYVCPACYADHESYVSEEGTCYACGCNRVQEVTVKEQFKEEMELYEKKLGRLAGEYIENNGKYGEDRMFSDMQVIWIEIKHLQKELDNA